MSVGAISTSNVNAIKGTEFEGMSIQMMAAMVMLEVGATKKKEAEMKISDMKAQNDKAKKLNDFMDRLNAQLGGVTGDSDDEKKVRADVLKGFYEEAKSLGIDTSSWGASEVNLPASFRGASSMTQKVLFIPSKSAEQVRAITSQIQLLRINF